MLRTNVPLPSQPPPAQKEFVFMPRARTLLVEISYRAPQAGFPSTWRGLRSALSKMTSGNSISLAGALHDTVITD